MGKKVLVVDDSEVVLAMAGDALTEGGLDAVLALTIMEANGHLFKTEKPDVIVLDVMMPMLSGYATATLLKRNSATSHIPILLLSSKPENELRRLVMESGAEGYIRKPFSKQQFVAKVREAMSSRC